MSPDGTRLAYVSREGSSSVDQLYVRELDKLAAVQLDGAAEMAVGNRKAGGFDDMRCHVKAGAKPKNRPGVLGNIGLEKRNLHAVIAL